MKNKKERVYPNYYAIIPAPVRYNRALKGEAKILYGEITALSNKNGYCNASNGYFADLYGVTERTVSRWLGLLKRCGYLSIFVDKGCKRRVYLKLSHRQKCLPLPIQTDRQKCLHNSTSINNTSIRENLNKYKKMKSGLMDHLKMFTPKIESEVLVEASHEIRRS